MTAPVAPVAPLAPAELLVLLVQLATMLTLGLTLGQAAARLGLPAIVGELTAGVLLGPSVLGHVAPSISQWLFPHKVAQMHLLDAVGQVGVLLLVGVAGAYVDMGMVRRRGATAARISVAGLTIPLALGVFVGLLCPPSLIPPHTQRPVFALFIGVAMCVTAIPVIAKTLADMRLTHRDVGQLTLTAATLDDTVGWFLLSIVSAIATVGLVAGRVATAIVYLLGFVAAAVIVGRPLVRLALRVAARKGDVGLITTTSVVIIFLGGATTQALGMEAVFGAFVAGMLIGAPGVVDMKALAPLRTLVLSVLAPIFLATVGLRMDLAVLGNPVVLGSALVALAVAIVGKFAGAYLGALTSRLGHWEGIAIGAGMNARGVIQIIVGFTGLRLGVLTITTFTIIALISVVTSVMAAPVLRFAMKRVSHNAEELLRKADHDAWSASEGWRIADSDKNPS
jgi:Kef-type K+ transport system membrane component KefB